MSTIVPVIIPQESDNSGKKLEIELCKTLNTNTEQRECLLNLKKEWEHDNMILASVLIVVVIIMVIVGIWMCKD